jgi:AraC-like DNA-binding protein
MAAAGVQRITHDTRVRLHRTRDLLAARCEEPLTLHDAAYEACLSPFHFHRLFSQAFGRTPHEFLTERRMEQAKRLLTQSDLSVTEICFELGYSSLGSFSSLFQKTVGCTPTDYRIGSARFHSLYRVWSHRFVPTCAVRTWFSGAV